METFKMIVEHVGLAISAIGVAIIVIALFVALFRALVGSLRKKQDAYRTLREQVGRGILLGLEFLVAADIIRTVSLQPHLQSVLVLGLVVLIRTFLSVALEVEIEGRWPWNKYSKDASRKESE